MRIPYVDLYFGPIIQNQNFTTENILTKPFLFLKTR